MAATLERVGLRTTVRWTLHAVSLARAAAAPQLFGTLALTVLDGLVPIAVAWTTRALFNALSANTGTSTQVVVVWCVAGLVAAGVGAGVVQAAQAYLQSVLHRRVRLEVRTRLFVALNREPGIGQFEDSGRQDRIRLAEQAGDTAPQQAITAGIQLTQAAITTAGFALTLALLLPWLVPVVFVAAVPIVVLQLRLGRLRADTVTDTSVYYRRLLFYRLLATDVRAAKEIRLFGLGDYLTRRMLRDLGTASRIEQDVDRTTARLGVAIAGISGLVDLVGISLTAFLAVRGRLSIGDVTALLTALVALHQIFRAATDQASSVYQAILLFGHYLALTEPPPEERPPEERAPEERAPEGERPAGRQAAPRLATLEFDDVWFRYADGLPWVLRGVSFRLSAGTATGLVGLNGAGKTTIVKLVCRMYRPDRGTIRWNGTDIQDLDPASLRARVSAVFQDFMSYDFTAADNIAIGNLEHQHDEDRIAAAARLAGVHDTIQALPHGYRTLLSRIFPTDESGERSATLSGGEWQRVALARAFLRDDADVLILDEPSSGLDAQLEHALHQRLQRLRTRKLTLLISHRLNALRDADRIIVLKDGRIAEAGTHGQLLERSGHYAELFTLQARGYQEPQPDGADKHHATEPTHP